MNAPTLRPELEIFAERMEHIMRKHDHKKGDAWKQSWRWQLFNLLREHQDKLSLALRPSNAGKSWDFSRAMDEAAHVANYAMMICAHSQAEGRPLAVENDQQTELPLEKKKGKAKK